jgi:hypothetical protein
MMASASRGGQGRLRLVDCLLGGIYDQRERYAKPIAMVQEGPMLRQLLVGIAVSVCNIAIHAVVMATVVEISSRIARAHHTAQQSVRLTIVMIATVSVATVPVLMAAHLSEVMVWALAYVIVDAAPAGADPVYFAFVNYTTLGYGDVIPVERWRLLGPITAMNGVLMFGWSTAVIFEVLRRTARHEG